MNIREIKLYDCTLDGDFKETTEGNYSSILKATIGEFENNLILFELNKEQYEYITSLDYKKIRFNVKGHMQVRKNKKDVPFLYFKVNFIMSEEDLAKVQKSKKERFEKIEKQKKVKQEFISWKPAVKELNFEQKLINPMKIKLLDTEHKKNNSIKIQYKDVDRELEAAVKPIEGTDQYELVFGWKDAMTAKIFGEDIKCYIVNKTRKEMLEQFSVK